MPGDNIGRHAYPLVFIGIPFVAIALLFLVLSVLPSLYESWQVRRWQAVPAELLETHLETSQIEGGTLYKVTARYLYHWRGSVYLASRVGLSGGADNVGEWHQRTYQRLLASRNLTVWVDPGEPGKAIIDRGLRWELFAFRLAFIALFATVGIAFIINGLRLRLSADEPSRSPPQLNAPPPRPPLSTTTSRPTGSAQLPTWLRLDYQGGGLTLSLPAQRNRAMGIPLALFGVLFGGVGFLLLRHSSAPLLFALLFMLMGGSILLFGLYTLGNTLLSSVSPLGVEVTRRIYGIPLHRQIPLSQLRGFSKCFAAQAGSRHFYRVQLKLRDGHDLTVADALSEEAADYLVARLAEHVERMVGAPERLDAPQLVRRRSFSARSLAHYLAALISLIVMARFVFEFILQTGNGR